MKIEKAIEVFRELLDETRNSDGTMCNQPYYCKAFRKDRERTNKCPFGTCEACERVVAFDTIVGFVNKARGCGTTACATLARSPSTCR
jgi:hypothetical protein